MSIKYWIQHNNSRIITAVVFCLVFSLLAFAPPFTTSAHALAIVDDAIIGAIVIAFLASAGITYAASNGRAGALASIQASIERYCAINSLIWANVKSAFDFGVDKLGNLITNNSFLTFASSFSEWLKNDLGLTNNSSVTNASIHGVLPIVSNPTFQNITSADFLFNTYRESNVYGAVVSDGLVLAAVISNDGGSTLQHNLMLSLTPNTVYWANHHTNRVNSATLTLNGDYYIYSYEYTTTNAHGIGTDCLTFSSRAEAMEYMLPAIGSAYRVVASSGTISIPESGVDYTDTDGALIDGYGSWGDSLDDVIDGINARLEQGLDVSISDVSLSVESIETLTDSLAETLLSPDNWPGLLPPSDFPEFSFSSIWHYVTDWLAAFSGTLATVLGISFALPAVSIVYAVIVLSLTLWLLRKVSS